MTIRLSQKGWGVIPAPLRRKYGLKPGKPAYVLDSYAMLAYLNGEAGQERDQGHAISYADAFVVALVQAEKAIALTGDPEFETVAEEVSIEWLG